MQEYSPGVRGYSLRSMLSVGVQLPSHAIRFCAAASGCSPSASCYCGVDVAGAHAARKPPAETMPTVFRKFRLESVDARSAVVGEFNLSCIVSILILR